MPSIQNSLHTIDAETENALMKYRERDKALLESNGALARLRHPTKDERLFRQQIAGKAMKAFGLDVATEYKQLEELSKNRVALFAETARDRYVIHQPARLAPTPTPVPTDHSFWWSKTEWTPANLYKWAEYEISGSMPGDAVVFYGWVAEHNGDLRQGSFWARAEFELQRNRVPPSRSNRWISAPTVDIRGTISGIAPAFDPWQPFDGDHWAKCSMTCAQRIYQHGFGGEDVELANQRETTRLFDHENGGSTNYVLPGVRAMPAVEFPIPGVADSVWATLEIAFAYQVEGSGSFVDFAEDPVALTFRQWEPIGK